MNSIKTCTKCGVSKTLDEFNRYKNSKDGRYPQCKECKRKYYLDNKEEISDKAKEHYQKHREERIKQRMVYYHNNKEETLEKNKEYYRNNKEKIATCTKEYREKNKEKIAEQKKEFYQNNKEGILKKASEYYLDNKDEIGEKVKNYVKTDAGKISVSKTQAKRKRELGYTPLNNRFGGCEGHHVDNERVIFIPAEMHRSNPHRQSDPNSMIKINRLAFNYLKKECCA